MISNVLNLFKNFLPSEYRLKMYTINLFVRFFSVVLTLGIYTIIKRVFPEEIIYHLEISVISSAVLALFLVLPLQEYLEVRLKQLLLSEYLFDDPSTLRVVSRRLEYDTLISNVFPDMVNISGSSSGRIATLNKQGSGFNIYTYSKGKHNKVKKKNYLINDVLIDFLKQYKEGVSIDQCIKYPEINDYFISLKANYILPFLFRDKLFGFLAVSDIPFGQDRVNLMLLASKAALAVYNHILSSQIAVHAKYKKEFEVANKIETLIFTKSIPNFKGFYFRVSKENTNNILMEFISGGDYNLFVILTLGINRIGSGLVASYLLGSLYSQNVLKKRHNFNSIKNLIDESLKELSWTEGYELLIGRFHEDVDEISFQHSGLNFKIFSDKEPNVNYLASGWKIQKDIRDSEVHIHYRNHHVLSIQRVPLEPIMVVE